MTEQGLGQPLRLPLWLDQRLRWVSGGGLPLPAPLSFLLAHTEPWERVFLPAPLRELLAEAVAALPLVSCELFTFLIQGRAETLYRRTVQDEHREAKMLLEYFQDPQGALATLSASPQAFARVSLYSYSEVWLLQEYLEAYCARFERLLEAHEALAASVAEWLRFLDESEEQ